MIFTVDDILVSSDIVTECFCCDLDACHGACCVEGDGGAPVTIDEIMMMEDALPEVEDDMSDEARDIVVSDGVAYLEHDGTVGANIVDGRECCFSFCKDGCTLCAFEKAYREGRSKFRKPISCALYPIREKAMSNGTVALNYSRWDICSDAVENGRRNNIRIYEFLKGPLTERFGEEWYVHLVKAAAEIRAELEGK